MTKTIQSQILSMIEVTIVVSICILMAIFLASYLPLSIVTLLIGSFAYIEACWMANAAPVIFGGGTPIDHGKLWKDGRRIFGDHKSIRGFIAAVIAGMIGGFLEIVLWNPFYSYLFLPFFPGFPPDNPLLALLTNSWANQILTIFGVHLLDFTAIGGILLGGILGTGAMVGDLIGSFWKRRRNLPSGQSFIPMDQIGFIVFALILAYPFAPAPLEYWIILIPGSFLIHIVANVIGYILHIHNTIL